MTSVLTGFVWGNQHGLTFERVKGPNDNALALKSCDRWAYIGGQLSTVNYKSKRFPSRHVVQLQAKNNNEMQNVEFSFCNAMVIKSAKMWPARKLSFQHGFDTKTVC